MSDTDDTDALLSCDPGGGLQQALLGMTLDDVSSSQMYDQFQEKKANNCLTKELAKASINGVEPSLDISDYFNSDGELVLSGLSQFSETSVSISDGVLSSICNDNNVVNKRDNNGNTKACSSLSQDGDDDETGSAASTIENIKAKSSMQTNEEDSSRVNSSTNSVTTVKEVGQGDAGKRRNDLNGKSKIEVVNVDRKTVPKEVQENLKRQLEEANSTNPEIQEWLGNHSNQISYGVLNLNLNDLKTFAEGLSRCDFFPKAEKVSTFVPTKNDKGEQIFTRAPNFRRPGGYKPPKNPPKCRDLTDEQIQEEVKRMYQFPDVDDDNLDSVSVAANKAKLNKAEDKQASDNTEDNKDKTLNQSADDEQNAKIKFNFLNDSSISNEFEFGKGKEKLGKSMKRKLLPNDGKICGGTTGSIPDLGFGLRNLSLVEVKEPTVERTRAWVTTSREATSPTESLEQESKEKPEMNVNISNPTTSTSCSGGETQTAKSTFSFGYGKEEELLSPIKFPANLSSNPQLSALMKSVEVPSPNSKKYLPRNRDPRTHSSTLASSTSESEISGRKETESNSKKGESDGSVVLPIPTLSSFQKSKPPNRRPIKKAGSKFKGMAMASSRDWESSHAASNGLPNDLRSTMAVDLEKILSDIDLPAEEIESLIENLDEGDMDLSKSQLFNDIAADEDNLADTFSGLKLDAWRTTDSETLSDKFHSEVFKREQCEKELRALQESFLCEKQQNAVLEGTLKRRNLMLVQITMAFNRVCKEWTKFDHENKAAVHKLHKNQKLLAHAYKRSRDRISQYEKELHKTLEMADSFKTKLADLQQERDKSVTLLKGENRDLENRIQKLKESLESLTNERDATLRALRETQIKLDDGKQTMESLNAAIKDLESKDAEHIQQYDELLQAKSFQDSNFLDVIERRNELEALLMKLTTELKEEKSSKDKLKRDLQDEVDRKNKAEADRLHEYYNKKVQEILKSATEEATRAEAALKEQMKRASLESERKLADYKERFQNELQIVRSRYEAEIEKLKRENLHRQLLISSTVKQLQMGESPNLDVNVLSSSTLQNSRIPQLANQKDILDAFKRHSNGDIDGSLNKTTNGNFSKLSKFTLLHLPAALANPNANQHQSSKGSYSAFHDYVPFDAADNTARFKTSTPIDSQTELTNNSHQATTGLQFDPNGIADYRKMRNNLPITSVLEPSSMSSSDKVRSEKSVNETIPNNSNGTFHSAFDLKHVLSHLLEAPVKPEKEQQVNSNFTRSVPAESLLDPAMQRCIQDLLKCYTETRLQANNKGSLVSNSTSATSTTNNNTRFNKNFENTSSYTENHFEPSENHNAITPNDDSESQASQIISQSYSRISSSRTETRNVSKSSKPETGKDQQSSQIKPPWK